MTILLKNCFRNIIRFAGISARILAWGFGLAYALAGTAHAWVTLTLPNLTSSPSHGAAVAFSHLPDGRLVYGNNNHLYLQDTFGAVALTAYTTPPGSGVDPSFITVLTNTAAVVGGGGFFPTLPIYQFNPSSTASPGYATVLGSTIQNYAAAPRNATSLYVTGTNGTNSNAPDSVNYVTLSGTSQLLVDGIAPFSSGIAVDLAGDLFVAADDNTFSFSSIYKFTAAQLQTAIGASSVLSLADGVLVHTFASDVGGSLTVDSTGRIWASGFGADGLFWWDPAHNGGGVLTPETPGGIYAVNAFSDGANNYLSYVWQASFSAGSPVHYGYDLTQNVPEPATSAAIAALVAGVAALWKRRRRTIRA